MDAQNQEIFEPTADDRASLTKQRDFVASQLADDASRENFRTSAGKLGTIDAILNANLFKPTQTYELQCLGIVLGDVFEKELGMEWITVEDEHGRDPALRLPGTSLILYPLTMISKRIERGEKVDVFELFNGIAAQVNELIEDDRVD